MMSRKLLTITPLVGLTVALGSVLLANKLEGGHVNTLIQPNVALAVFGRTLGAVLLQFRFKSVLGSVRALKYLIQKNTHEPSIRLAQLQTLLRQMTRGGIQAPKAQLEEIADPVLSKGISMVADGSSPWSIQHSLEAEIGIERDEWREKAQVWNSMGRYSLWVALVGFIFGTIHALSNLGTLSNTGKGIAFSVISMLYGFGVPALVFYPIAEKIKAVGEEIVKCKELSLTFVLLMHEEMNPPAPESGLAQAPPEQEQVPERFKLSVTDDLRTLNEEIECSVENVNQNLTGILEKMTNLAQRLESTGQAGPGPQNEGDGSDRCTLV